MIFTRNGEQQVISEGGTGVEAQPAPNHLIAGSVRFGLGRRQDKGHQIEIRLINIRSEKATEEDPDVQVEVTGGGLMLRRDPYAFEAPEAGYKEN